MNERAIVSRISCSPEVLAGKPVIRGTRLSVEFILNLMAKGATAQSILEEYGGLELDDIQACLLFASQSLSGTSYMPLVAETA